MLLSIDSDVVAVVSDENLLVRDNDIPSSHSSVARAYVRTRAQTIRWIATQRVGLSRATNARTRATSLLLNSPNST